MHEPLAPEVRAALAQCRWMIRKGSKSFSLAARLFDPATRDAAFFLYGWCRYCDDQVDGLGAAANPAVLHNRLAALRARTAAAFASEPVEEPVFIALQYIARRYAIPSHYATELIEGMAMDVNATRYRSFAELVLYCYRVAGTVGLMMAHVMGVRDEQALRHAAHLGIAMQLTNIARDVIEDAALGRVYLPLSWLDEAGINAAEIAAAKNRPALARIVARLLAEADRYYRSGDQGLWHLSFRSACAVAAARAVYAEIGARVRRSGARAWDERRYVGTGRKSWVIARALSGLLRSLPARWAAPWSPVAVRTVWQATDVSYPAI
jgi:phytoene synthase